MSNVKLSTKNLTPAKADFITQQCEKALQRTLEDRTAIQKKGTFVLGILTALIAFGIQFAIEHSRQLSGLEQAFLGGEIAVLISLGIAIIYGYMPSRYAGHGYDPSKIIVGSFIDQSLENMKVGYAHVLQRRINYNRAWNVTNANKLKWITFSVFLSPILTFALVWLVFWIGLIP